MIRVNSFLSRPQNRAAICCFRSARRTGQESKPEQRHHRVRTVHVRANTTPWPFTKAVASRVWQRKKRRLAERMDSSTGTRHQRVIQNQSCTAMNIARHPTSPRPGPGLARGRNASANRSPQLHRDSRALAARQPSCTKRRRCGLGWRDVAKARKSIFDRRRAHRDERRYPSRIAATRSVALPSVHDDKPEMNVTMRQPSDRWCGLGIPWAVSAIAATRHLRGNHLEEPNIAVDIAAWRPFGFTPPTERLPRPTRSWTSGKPGEGRCVHPA